VICLLLPAADAVGKRAVGAHVVELRGRLVVPAAPRLAAVDADDRPLVGGEDHHVGAVGVDPDPLVVVAPRRAAKGRERLPAVRRLPGHDRGDEDRVGVRRVHAHLGRVVRARDHARVGVDAPPALPGVVRAVDTGPLPRLHGRVHPPRIAGSDRDPDPAEALREGGQAGLDRPPAVSAVRRLVEPAALAGEDPVLPRSLPRLPEDGIHRVRVAGAEGHVGRADVLVDVEELLERLAAVCRAVDPPLLVRTVRVAEDRHEEPLLVLRVHDDLRDLLAVAEAEVGPGPPAVPRAVDPVAGREVGPLHALPAADVDDVGVGGGDGDRADRAGGLVVEDRLPRPAVVGRLPDAAVHDADVEEAGPPGDARGGLRAAAAEGADRPPAQLGEEAWLERRAGLGHGHGSRPREQRHEGERPDGRRQRAAQGSHLYLRLGKRSESTGICLPVAACRQWSE
jgi:hypothetical protein